MTPNTARRPADRLTWSPSPARTTGTARLFGYFRNSVFDARNFNDYDLNGNPAIPPFRLGQYGLTFGGPIKKDNTFFFVSYRRAPPVPDHVADWGCAECWPCERHPGQRPDRQQHDPCHVVRPLSADVFYSPSLSLARFHGNGRRLRADARISRWCLQLERRCR